MNNYGKVVRKAPCIVCGVSRDKGSFSIHESRCRGCNSARVNARTKALRVEALTILGGSDPRCAKCTSQELLEVDHVNGGGSAHRRRVARQRYYQEIIAGADFGAYRVLCGSCNGSKTKRKVDE